MAVLSPATLTATSAYPQPLRVITSPKNSPPSILPLLPFRQLLTPRYNRSSRLRHSHAALSPPPPPPSEPPPEKDPVQRKGAVATLSKFQDRVRIFFAVLFWLSLFFWASAWDGGNDGSGRRNKGSRFRR